MLSIQPSPIAPEGSVEHLASYLPSDFPPTACILCRNTAPLISFAFSLIQRSIPCRVLGREIGQGLLTLIDKLKPDSLESLDLKLTSYESKQRARLLARFDESGAEAISDKCQCIRIIAESCDTLDQLKTKITSLFTDSVSGLTLATVHKSKGLEWPLVFILDFDLMPSKWARQPWQKVQERNLIYVARTRAQLDLRYIKSGNWKTGSTREEMLKED